MSRVGDQLSQRIDDLAVTGPQPDGKRMFTGIAHSFGVRAVTRDARAVYFNDMAAGPAGDQIPSRHGLNFEPDGSL